MTMFPGTQNVNGGFQYPESGLNNTAEYLASGLPFVQAGVQAATPTRIEFPYVTSEIYISVSGSSEIRIGFSQNGINGSNYFVVKGGDSSLPIRVRCKEIYIRSHAGSNDGYSIMAAMTMIPGIKMPTLSGSQANPETGRVMFQSSSAANIFGYNGIG